jgi:hypothetical protein
MAETREISIAVTAGVGESGQNARNSEAVAEIAVIPGRELNRSHQNPD